MIQPTLEERIKALEARGRVVDISNLHSPKLPRITLTGTPLFCELCGEVYDIWWTSASTWKVINHYFRECSLCVNCFNILVKVGDEQVAVMANLYRLYRRWKHLDWMNRKRWKMGSEIVGRASFTGSNLEDKGSEE